MANIRSIKLSGTSYNVYDINAMHNISTSPATSIVSEISNANYTTATYSVGLGYNSLVYGSYATAIGASSYANSSGVALGMQARAESSQAIAIGGSTTARAIGSVQIGNGTNANQYSLQFRTYPLVDENGKIPMERLHSDLIVTTTDPLPDPNGLSVGSTQLYQGEDTEDFQKNHMYSVAEDPSIIWGTVLSYPYPIVPEPAKNIKIDMQKFLGWVRTNIGHFQGIAKFTKITDSSSAVNILYQAATGHFVVAVSTFVFERAGAYQVDTGYTTLQQIKDNLGVEINPELWNPTTSIPPVPFVVIAASTAGFGVTGPLALDQTEQGSMVISDAPKFIAKLRSTITGDNGDQYTMKFDNTEQISFWRTGEAQWGFTITALGQSKVTIYANSASVLLNDWGINVIKPASFTRLLMIQLVNTFGHKWAEGGLDLKSLPGFDTEANQVLKNSTGTIQWGTGGSGGSEEDNVTITKNAQDKIQAVGLINKNSSSTDNVFDWVGTLAEYTSQNIETQHPDWICYITDDVRPTESGFPMWKGTATQYNAITNKDPNTLYIITE